jgi:hypothetical protein
MMRNSFAALALARGASFSPATASSPQRACPRAAALRPAADDSMNSKVHDLEACTPSFRPVRGIGDQAQHLRLIPPAGPPTRCSETPNETRQT